MSRTLSATLQELTSKRTLSAIPVVKLTRITDHSGTPTKTTPAYFTSKPVSGVYGVPSTNPQLPFLMGAVFPVETMPHLPSPVGGGVDSLTRRVQFTLANVQYQGVSLFEFLTSGAEELDQAELVMSMLLVPNSEMVSPFIDSATAGETLEFFDGIVDRVVSVGNTIDCRGKSLHPITPWKLVPDDGEDPRDRGLRLPLVLGKGAIVRCVNLQIGTVSTLSQQLAIDATTIAIDDSSGFPSSGSAMVAAEAVSWTAKLGNLLTGVTRSEGGSNAANHVTGTFVLEIDTVVLGVSSLPVSSVVALYVLGPSGTSTRVSSLLYTATLDDEVNAPGGSGDGITTISFTSEQMAALVNDLHADATITQQAEYTDTAPVNATTTDSQTHANQSLITGVGAQGTWTNVGLASVNWVFSKVSSNTQDLASPFVFSDLSASTLFDTLVTVRFEFTVLVNTASGGSLSVGLRITGAEGILSGAADGTIVAAVDITATGSHVVEGTVFVAEEGQLIAAIQSCQIDFVKGPAPGGNPAFDIDIEDVRVRYTSIDDTTSYSSIFERVPFATSPTHPAQQVNGPTIDSVTHSNMLPGSFSGTPGVNNPGFVNTGSQEKYLACAVESDHFDDGGSPPPTGTQLLESIVLSTSIDEVPDSTAAYKIVMLIRDVTSSVIAATVTPKSVVVATGGAASVEHEFSVADGSLNQGLTSASFIGAQIVIWFEGGDGPAGTGQFTDSTNIKFKYQIKSLFIPIERPIDAQIQASSGAAGLEFFAICDGPEADDGTWNAASGEVLKHPGDLIRYWLEDVNGVSASDVDSATLSGSAYNTSHPDYEFGFDARNLGGTFEQVLLRLGYEGAMNIIRPSGGDWTIKGPDVNFKYGPAPTLTLDSLANLIAVGKDFDEILTRLTVFSHFDPRLGGLGNESFAEVQTTDTGDGLVIAREDMFGQHDADPNFLLCHRKTEGATAWRLHQEHELGRQARIFVARVDHWQGFDLEVGDVRLLEHPQADGGSAVKVRILEVVPSTTAGLRIRCVEVLTP